MAITFLQNINLDDGSGASPSILFTNGSDDAGGISINSSGKIEIQTGGSVRQTIGSSDTTFAGDVIATDGSDTATLKFSGLVLSRSNSYIQSNADNSDTLNIGQSSVRWGHVKVDGADFAVFNGGTERFKIDSSGDATFAGTLSATVNADDATYTGIVTVDGGTFKYRTKAEILSDIGAGTGSGTVTSIGITETGTALTITNTPITGSGNINIAGAGTSSRPGCALAVSSLSQ